jgi:hypothetical protein
MNDLYPRNPLCIDVIPSPPERVCLRSRSVALCPSAGPRARTRAHSTHYTRVTGPRLRRREARILNITAVEHSSRVGHQTGKHLVRIMQNLPRCAGHLGSLGPDQVAGFLPGHLTRLSRETKATVSGARVRGVGVMVKFPVDEPKVERFESLWGYRERMCIRAHPLLLIEAL